MTTTHTTSPCPPWCDHRDDPEFSCFGDHWTNKGYVPASRSEPVHTDISGATLPSVAAGVATYRNQGNAVFLHVSATGGADPGIDVQVNFTVQEAVKFTGTLLAALTDALKGQPCGLFADDVLPIRDHAAAVLAAHEGEAVRP